MAQALFITIEDIKKFAPLNGNIDPDELIQFMKTAHDIHIQQYLGTDLFNKIGADILASTLTGNYLALNTNYIKPMAIWWTMVEYLPFAAYTIANKGVYKHGSENSESVEKNEIDYLLEACRSKAENYTQRFIDYMCENSATFPEYTSNSGEDIHPTTTNYTSEWYLL